MKITDLLDQYEAAAKLRGVNPSQLKALVPVRRAFAQDFVGDLSPTRVQLYVSDRLAGRHTKTQREATPGTIRRELGALTAALNWAASRGLIDRAPRLDLPAQSPARDFTLDKERADGVFNAAAFIASNCIHELQHVGLFVCLALDTWARAEAIETLTWDRVDLATGRIDYRDPTRPACKKRRAVVPISTRLSALLSGLVPVPRHPDDDLVTGPVSAYDWGCFKRLVGAPAELTRHDLRRTGISLAVARGVDLLKVATMAGDDYGTILKHYARFAPNYLEGVVE